jgi:hypothetical protein
MLRCAVVLLVALVAAAPQASVDLSGGGYIQVTYGTSFSCSVSLGACAFNVDVVTPLHPDNMINGEAVGEASNGHL